MLALTPKSDFASAPNAKLAAKAAAKLIFINFIFISFFLYIRKF
jgi:hypothetical protein